MYAADQSAKDTKSLPVEISNIEGEVTDVVVSGYWLFVLKSDGTVVSTRYETDSSSSRYDYSSYIESVNKGISTWKGIVYIQPAVYGFVGVEINGNVSYQSTDYDSTTSGGVTKYTLTMHSDIESVIESWKDIVYISSNLWGLSDSAEKDALGLHSDGTVSSLNTGKYLTLEVNSNDKYYVKSHYDGTHDKTNSWKLWSYDNITINN